MSLRLPQKAIILVTIPVLFEVGLAGAVATSLMRGDQARIKETRARELTGHLNNIMSMHLQQVAFLALSNSAPSQTLDAQMTSLKTKMLAESASVNKIAFPDAAPKEKWKAIVTLTKNLDDTFTLARLYYSKNSKVAATFEFAKVQNYLDELIDNSQQLQDSQMQLSNDCHQELSRSSQEIQLAMWAAVLGSLLIAAGLLIYFNRGTTNRLRALVHTGQLIAGGQPASKTLSGDDELAALDKSLHQLQDALKNMRQRERTILDNAAEIICTMDEDLRFSDINNAVQKIWGFRPAELLGKKATDMMEKQDQKAAIKALRDASQSAPEGGQVHFEARVTRADGTISDTRWSASYSANTRTICCLVKDSTEHQDIGRLNQAFVTMVRDDLQTPLTAIQMAHSMIEQDLRERPTGNQITQKNLVIGRDNINRLMLLVNNLLDADKGQSEQIDLVLQQQLLLPVVQAAADSLSAIAQNTKVTVGIYVDPKLMAYFDREKLIKVLVSLISNAYKFSPQSAQVRVVAVATEGKERGFVRLAVIDQGPGVPPAMQGKIFEGFRQSEATEGRSQTVGLSICKAIIEQHRGQMGVKSQDGNGSTFWFTVPSQPARKDW